MHVDSVQYVNDVMSQPVVALELDITVHAACSLMKIIQGRQHNSDTGWKTCWHRNGDLYCSQTRGCWERPEKDEVEENHDKRDYLNFS